MTRKWRSARHSSVPARSRRASQRDEEEKIDILEFSNSGAMEKNAEFHRLTSQQLHDLELSVDGWSSLTKQRLLIAAKAKGLRGLSTKNKTDMVEALVAPPAAIEEAAPLSLQLRACLLEAHFMRPIKAGKIRRAFQVRRENGRG